MGSNGWAWFTKHAPSPAYKIAKAAMNMLNTQYAMYLQDEGFTCLLISPGVSPIHHDNIQALR